MKLKNLVTTFALIAGLLAGGAAGASMPERSAAAESADGAAAGVVYTEDGEKIVCPEGWDSEDPGWVKAYRSRYGDGGEESIQTGSSSGGVRTLSADYPVNTTWKNASNKTMRFYHHKDSIEGNEIVPVIDISKWNATVDYSKLKKAGVEGVIIRCGYRSMGTAGTIYADPYFTTNMKAAKKAGMHIGVYFFSQAITVKEAQKEAAYTLAAIEDNDFSSYVDMPVVIDMENVDGTGRMLDEKNSKSKQTKITLAFLDAVKEAGYQGMVYSGSNFLVSNINGDTIYEAGYPIWLARYNSYAFTGGSGFYKNTAAVTIWQCTSQAIISGIKNKDGSYPVFDLNYWYRKEGEVSATTAASEEDPQVKAPAKVTGVKKTASTAASVTVGWSAVSDADGYEVLWSKALNGNYKGYSASEKKTSYSFTGLAVNTEYYVKVRAYSVENGTKVYGKESSIVRVSTTKDQSFCLKTTENMNLRQYAGTSYKVLATVNKGKAVTFVRWTKASDGKTWAKVTWNGKTGYISKAGLAYCAGQVKELKASKTEKKSVTLSWKKVKGAKFYQVYRSTSPDSGFEKVAKVKKKTSFENSGLKRKTTYYYKVRAYKKVAGKNRNGLYSEVLKVKTK